MGKRRRSSIWITMAATGLMATGLAATVQADTVVIDLPPPPPAKPVQATDKTESSSADLGGTQRAPGAVALAAYQRRAAPRTTYGFVPRSAGWYGSRSYYGYPYSYGTYGTYGTYGYCGTGAWPFFFVSHTHRGFRPVSHDHHHGHSGFRPPPMTN